MTTDAPVALASHDMWQPAPDSGVRVDTIQLKGPTDRRLMDELWHVWYDSPHRTTDGRIEAEIKGGRMFVPVGFGHAYVGFQEWNAQPTVTVSMSLPRLWGPHNGEGAELDEIEPSADAILYVLRQQIPYVPTLDAMSLHRLDLVRDFRCISRPQMVLAGLDSLPGSGLTSNWNIKDDHNELQTLYRGTKSSWEARAYSKANEMLHRADRSPHEDALRAWAEYAPRQLRFEVELRRKALRYLDLLDASRLDTDRLRSLARGYFERAGWDRPVVGGAAAETIISEIARHEGKAAARNVRNYLHAISTGGEPLMSHNTLDAAKRNARRYGLGMTSRLFDGVSTLDFESGWQVLTPA